MHRRQAVAGCVSGRFNLQLVRRLHEHEAMVSDWLCVAAEEVGVDVECACHLRRGRERELGLPVFEVEITGQNRLPIACTISIYTEPRVRVERTFNSTRSPALTMARLTRSRIWSAPSRVSSERFAVVRAPR